MDMLLLITLLVVFVTYVTEIINFLPMDQQNQLNLLSMDMLLLIAVLVVFVTCVTWSYTFYTSFWKHFNQQREVQNEEQIPAKIEAIEEKIDTENLELVETNEEEEEQEDSRSKLDLILESLERQREEDESVLRLWRRLKDQYYFSRANERLSGEISEQEALSQEFWYEHYLLLENFLFGRTKKKYEEFYTNYFNQAEKDLLDDFDDFFDEFYGNDADDPGTDSETDDDQGTDSETDDDQGTDADTDDDQGNESDNKEL